MADPFCFFNVGQGNSNGAGEIPAPFLLSTHILTHNTVRCSGNGMSVIAEMIGLIVKRTIVATPLG